MKKIRFLNAVALTVLFLAGESCTTSPSLNDKNNQDEIKTISEMTKDLIESNDYIDIDPLEIDNILASSTRSAESDDLEAKARAVLYRFCSHVSIENGKYTTTLKSASDINVSEKAFNFMMDNLVQINESLDSAYKNGEEVILGDVGEKYLKHLLK